MANREVLATNNIGGSILLPGSKYIANRLVPLCALAARQQPGRKSRLSNVVNNNDINTAISGLSQLGYQFEKVDNQLVISAENYALQYDKLNSADIYTAHSGTFSRFITAIAALESYPVNISCSTKMATRPMQEIFSALSALSVALDSPNGCLPATVKGPVSGNHCVLDASRSSQYLSALLMIAPLMNDGLTIELSGELVSRAYVDMTIKLMALMGVEVIEKDHCFNIPAGQKYESIDYTIPGDPVSATYFMGAAAIAGQSITIRSFDFASVQGESGFYQVLEKMGAKVEVTETDLTISASEQLQGIDIDMGGMPDAVQTLAVVACFAQGQTKITNIAHLAYKESNRIEDTATELRKAGIKVETGSDYMIIQGGSPTATEINTHQDHRMAMSMALLGIKTNGIKIINAEVVEKSFPDYWRCLSSIGLQSVDC